MSLPLTIVPTLRWRITLRGLLWLVVAAAVVLQYSRWLRLEWLPEIVTVLASALVAAGWYNRALKAICYGACAGAVAFTAGMLGLFFFQESVLSTPAGEFIFIILLIIGAEQGAICAAVVIVTLRITLRNHGQDKSGLFANWRRRHVLLKVLLVVLGVLSVCGDIYFGSIPTSWPTATFDYGTPVGAIAFSQNDTTLMIGGADGRIALWTWDNGTQRDWQTGAAVTALCLTSDGRRVASGDANGVVKVWDGNSGELSRTLRGHRDKITSLAFAPDGIRLVSCSGSMWPGNGDVMLWDSENGKQIGTFNWEGSRSAEPGCAWRRPLRLRR